MSLRRKSRNREASSSKAALSLPAFRTISSLALSLGAIFVYRLSPKPIGWLQPLVPEHPTAMAVLAVALTALAMTLVWALAMLPLRAKTDLPALGAELQGIVAAGGFSTALKLEQARLERMRVADEPAVRSRYHGRMAAAGTFVSMLSALLSFVMWQGESLLWEIAGLAILGPFFALYHAVRYLQCRRAAVSARRATG